MKILVVCQYYYPEPFRITDICEELVKRGNQVTVLTGLPNYPEGKIIKDYKRKEHRDEIRNGVRILRCYEHGRGKNSINLLWNYFSFGISGKRKINSLDKDFDLVFINQFSPIMMAWPGIKYAKKYGKKCVLYCYDLWPASLSAGGIKENSIIYKIFNKISRKIYEKVDAIAVSSKEFCGYLNETHGISIEKITHLPQYCEDIFLNVPQRVNNGIFNYVFAGNIGKMQSVETIIEAAHLLKDNKEILFHIVGDGRDLEKCKKLAKEKNLDNVLFYGRRPVEEMPKFYAMADAMIVTMSKDDLVSKTLPGKVQSYMAAGKPIIASADGETKTVITDSNCGFCCEAEDYNKLAALFYNFSNNPEISNPMSLNAKKYFTNNYTKSLFFNKLENLFEEAIK